MKKLRTGQVLGSVFKRLLSPRHLCTALQFQRRRKRAVRIFDDPQLKLYAEILPGGFLHYGYFDDPNTQPRDMSLNDISRAQHRYAELIVENIVDRDSPVLDIGCGMGGITKMMLDDDLCPVALSPDRHQIRHIKDRYPGVPTIESKFETMPDSQRQQKYGTLITAESLQYLDLDTALPLMDKLLKAGGRWIACDYFRIDAATLRSEGWEQFEKRIQASNFRFVSQRDITPHVTPTVRYIHMWARDIGQPVLNFCLQKFRTKQPGIHYLLQDALELFTHKAHTTVEVVNPQNFADKSKYMLLVMEKVAA